MSLSSVIRENKDRIIARLGELLDRRGPRGREHIDEIAAFLGELVDTLDRATCQAALDAAQAATAQGKRRFESGGEVHSLVEDLAALREVVVELLTTEGAHRVAAPEEIVCLHRCIDRAITGAVASYAHSRDAAVVTEQHRIHEVLQLTPVGIILADASGRFMDMNPEARRIWALPEGASAVASINDYSRFRGRDPETGRELAAHDWHLARTLETGETFVGQEIEIVAFDGTSRTILNSSAPLRDGEGKIFGAVAINVDITERALRLREARAEVRIRESVLGIVAHDLKNPLAAIHANAQLLRMGTPTEQGVRRLGDVIDRAVGRMQRLISDLLELSRIEAGQVSLSRTVWDARLLVREELEHLAPLAERSGVWVQKMRADSDVMVFADRDRVQQVLSNLLGNALKFTPEGGNVTVSIRREGDVVHFSVADTGVGIRPDDVPHVFERFWQAARQSHLGTGLGLAIAKGIVDAHGGRIWVTSEPERGSNFHFTLPAASAANR